MSIITSSKHTHVTSLFISCILFTPYHWFFSLFINPFHMVIHCLYMNFLFIASSPYMTDSMLSWISASPDGSLLRCYRTCQILIFPDSSSGFYPAFLDLHIGTLFYISKYLTCFIQLFACFLFLHMDTNQGSLHIVLLLQINLTLYVEYFQIAQKRSSLLSLL